jgi:hypothetical protein
MSLSVFRGQDKLSSGGFGGIPWGDGFSAGWLLGSKEGLSLGGLVGVPKQISAEMAMDH